MKKALQSYQMSGTTHPLMQCHTPDDLHLENRIHCHYSYAPVTNTGLHATNASIQ